jgi:glycosyltransferase involved in cell wall biosynthesis
MSTPDRLPRVTVLIPTYNRAQLLRRTVESVLAQTFQDLQLVVSDNASTDETPDVVASFGDERICYRRHPQNVGLLENHNSCLRGVETEYAMLLPDDDLLHADHLASAVAVLDDNPGVGFVHTAFDIIGPSDEVISEGVDWTYGLTDDGVEDGREFIRQSMYWSCRVCPSSVLMRAAAIHPDLYVEEEFPGIDFGLWLRIALDWDVAYLHCPLADFRVHSSSHSASFDEAVDGTYNHGVTTLTGVRRLKLRFLDLYGHRLENVEGLRRLVEAGMRRELVQHMRNTTVPARRFRTTVTTFRALARVEPGLLGEMEAWRLVAASALGARGVDWIKAHRRPRNTQHEKAPCSPPTHPPPHPSREVPLPPEVTGPPRTRLALTADARAYGGAEAYVAHLLCHLPESYECTLIATEPLPRQLEDAARARGAGVVTVPRVEHKSDMRGLLSLIRALRSVAADLVHVNMADTANHRYAIGAALLLRQPAVVTLHTAVAAMPGLQNRALRMVFRHPRLAIAVTDHIARHLHERIRLPASRVRTVTNGIPTTPLVERIRQNGDVVRIAAIGRLSEEKGIDLMVDAIRELVRRGRPVEGIIAGEGPELADLRRMAQDLPVRFLGFVDDMAGFMASADILCLPSRVEGLPFALLEAMMSGLPCVATAVGDVPTAVDGTGFVVPPGDVDALADALDELVGSPARRQALGRAAHERVCACYSLESMVDSTVRVYQEALSANGTSPLRPHWRTEVSV